jgi:hypothetical protein
MAGKMAAEVDNGSVAAPQQALAQGINRRDWLDAPAQKRSAIGDHFNDAGRQHGRPVKARLQAHCNGKPPLLVR